MSCYPGWYVLPHQGAGGEDCERSGPISTYQVPVHGSRSFTAGIARELGISRTTVQKYCQGGVLPEPKPRKRVQTVLTDNVRHERLRLEHGFEGSYESVARMVRQLRPEPAEVFIPLVWDPGDAMQVDWGASGRVHRGKTDQGSSLLCQAML